RNVRHARRDETESDRECRKRKLQGAKWNDEHIHRQGNHVGAMEVDGHGQRHGELHQRADEKDFEDGTSGANEENQTRSYGVISAQSEESSRILVGEVRSECGSDAPRDHSKIEAELCEPWL